MSNIAVKNAQPFKVTNDGAVINKMIKAFQVANGTLHGMAHAIMCSCTMHAIDHGNTTPANDFIEAFTGKSGWRVNAIREWFETFGPFTWNAEKKKLTFSKKKLEKVKNFNPDTATTFWEFKPEPPYRGLDLNAEIIRLVKKANEAIKETDPERVKKNKIDTAKLVKLAELVNLGTAAAA